MSRSVVTTMAVVALVVAAYSVGLWRGSRDGSSQAMDAEVAVTEAGEEARKAVLPAPLTNEHSATRSPASTSVSVVEPTSPAVTRAPPTDSLGESREFEDADSIKRDAYFNPEGKSLTQAEAAMLRDMILRFNQGIEALRQTEVKQAVDNHVDSLIAAGFYTVPEPGQPVRSSHPHHSISLRSDGTTSYVVEYDPKTVPEIAAARAALNQLRDEYRAEIRRFFSSIPDTD